MNTHLSAQEFVDALEGTLPRERQAHVSACDRCAREVAALRDVTGEARIAGEVPEPSPLFWDHFSRRVRAATDAEPMVAPRWWESAWRPVAVLAAVAGAVALIVLTNTGRATDPVTPATVPAAVAAESIADDGALNLIAEMASGLSTEELQQVERPSRHATAAVIEDLTPAQRAEFIRLIKAEIGDPE